MKMPPTITGFQDEGREQQTEKHDWRPGVRKDSEMDSPSETSEKNAVLLLSLCWDIEPCTQNPEEEILFWFSLQRFPFTADQS